FASLFIGLSKISQKKLSDDFGQKHSIRYGVLRNWCREKDFKEMAKGHAWEFANHLILHVETKCEESMSEWNDYFNLKTDEQPPELQFDEIYRDAMFFNESVLNTLAGLSLSFYELLADDFKRGELDVDMYNRICVVHAEIFKILTYASGGKYPEELKIKSEKAMIGQIKSIISSKRILSKKEQRFIIHAAETLEKWQEEKLIDEAGHKEKK
ncbi:MAG: hypothetical protein OET63_13405, partial [Desulfobacterales bacterium]|nr:hypothetical protein [Desulfobacterales bacterium]